ncbi:phosphate ABC transporter substrate-binding/OmpA family protein [Yoonia sp. SS1-5]|uniref:Phosphate ABC transporter substrate-binding/OmpA family protein n=1 Tax=Yoonia rhodophyticola TaxID=3137370 RepID=A0AAN0ML49_9RHOB
MIGYLKRAGVVPAICAVAVSWAGISVAETVSLTVSESNIQVDGELKSFDGVEFVVNVPALGDVTVPVAGATCIGPGCPAIIVEPGGEVTLTSEDGDSLVAGTLLDYKDGVYSVETVANILTVSAGIDACAGEGCPSYEVITPASVVAEEDAPEPVRRPANLVMVGSDNVGEDLMPLVMAPFAELLGASSVTDAIEFPDNIAQYIFTRADGSEYVLEVESTSSGPGLERLIAGTADIAMSSRQANADEVAAIAAQGRGDLLDVSQEYIVGVDSVLMTVHPSNPVDALSRVQLVGIYTDQITNWADVGGPDAPIQPGARDGGSARENFERWAFGEERDLSPGTVELDRGGDMRDFVEQNPGAIGYSISDNIGDTKAIDLILDCGVRTDATPFKSKAEEYLLGRRIRLYIDNHSPKAEVRQMAEMMINPAIDTYVAESGYFSLGIVEDDEALSRLTEAALIGQPPDIAASVQQSVSGALNGAQRLSLTFRFDTDEFVLDSKALRDLDRLVNYMNLPENADREFIFVGFADTVGAYEYNIGLSDNRANEVRLRAVNHPNAGAIPTMTLSTLGLSEAAPVGCNDDDYGRSRNRRVEVWVR